MQGIEGLRILVFCTLVSLSFSQFSDKYQLELLSDLLDISDEGPEEAVSSRTRSLIPSEKPLSRRYSVHPDTRLTIVQLIRKYGFPVEIHKMVTPDNYILTLHRIPFGRNNQNSTQKKPVVYIHHGLLGAATNFIDNTVEKSLAYKLADSGYDVWLANARGNGFSKGHLSLTPRQSQYWDFTYHEMGKYDFPTAIDYILKLTGQEKLNYIGHSMGGTIYFIAMSLRPEYNEKIRMMIGLAPAVYEEDMKSPFRILAPFASLIKILLDLLGNGEFFPVFVKVILGLIAPFLCSQDTLTGEICKNLWFIIMGFNQQQLNRTQLPVILSHSPAYTSAKTMAHFLQSVKSARFRQYDYGTMGNIQKYSQATPPEYSIKRATAPVAIFYSDADVLVDVRGIQRLAKEIPNLIGCYKVKDSKFSHTDFIFAKDADKLINNRVLKVLKSIP